jgi:hypothetical protein
MRDLQARLGLPENILNQVLSQMEKVGLVSIQGDDYVSDPAHLVLDPILHRKIIERSLVSELGEFLSTIQSRYDDPDQLVFTGSLSIRTRNLTKLKQRLKRDLTQTIDEYFDPSGDCVVSLHGLLLK